MRKFFKIIAHPLILIYLLLRGVFEAVDNLAESIFSNNKQKIQDLEDRIKDLENR